MPGATTITMTLPPKMQVILDSIAGQTSDRKTAHLFSRRTISAAGWRQASKSAWIWRSSMGWNTLSSSRS